MLTPTVTELARLSAHRHDIAQRVPLGAPGTGTGSGRLMAQAATRRVVGSAPLLRAAPAR
jgi:hypothetical protein